MWATIGMRIFYIVVAFSMSSYLGRQNGRADGDGSIELEGVGVFRYAP